MAVTPVNRLKDYFAEEKSRAEQRASTPLVCSPPGLPPLPLPQSSSGGLQRSLGLGFWLIVVGLGMSLGILASACGGTGRR